MAEQTAQDVVIETQLAGDSSSADGLGSTQTPLATQGDEEVAGQKEEAGSTEDITGSGANLQSASDKEQITGDATVEGTAQATEDQQTAAYQGELLESAGQRSTEESTQSSTIKGSASTGDVISVPGSSEDASHAGPDTATNSDTEAAGKNEEAEAKTISTIKKPAAFKSVSVTKNFLAKSGTPAPAATKALGDKRMRMP